jgi:hypothetical protein
MGRAVGDELVDIDRLARGQGGAGHLQVFLEIVGREDHERVALGDDLLGRVAVGDFVLGAPFAPLIGRGKLVGSHHGDLPASKRAAQQLEELLKVGVGELVFEKTDLHRLPLVWCFSFRKVLPREKRQINQGKEGGKRNGRSGKAQIQELLKVTGEPEGHRRVHPGGAVIGN